MVVLLIVAFGALAIIWSVTDNRKKAKALKELEAEYKKALQGSDKQLALQLGRNYYRALRGKGALTIYDEQAITNDLSTMRA